jgi:hypothetical protein
MRRKIGMACSAQLYHAVCLERKERRQVTETSSAKRDLILPGLPLIRPPPTSHALESTLQETQVQ